MNYLFFVLFAAIISFCITPLSIYLAKKFHLVDNPKNRKHPAHTHEGIIPRAGGIPLFFGILIPLFILFPITPQTIAIGIACLLLVIVGLIDDYRDVHPYIRILTNIIAIGIVLSSGMGVSYITNPVTGGILHLDSWAIHIPYIYGITIPLGSIIFTSVWLLWTVHIVGWSAGVDGQMPGFVTISALVLGFLALRYPVTNTDHALAAVLAFFVAGSFLGFLPWNFYPQRIMPGYGGKTLAGFLLGILGILSYGKVGTALLVLGIPTLDAAFTLTRRLWSHHSPVWADRGHLHHLLLDFGWGRRRIALFYWSVSAILGAIALTVTSRQKVFTFLLASVAFIGIILWVRFFSQSSKQPDQDNG